MHKNNIKKCLESRNKKKISGPATKAKAKAPFKLSGHIFFGIFFLELQKKVISIKKSKLLYKISYYFLDI